MGAGLTNDELAVLISASRIAAEHGERSCWWCRRFDPGRYRFAHDDPAASDGSEMGNRLVVLAGGDFDALARAWVWALAEANAAPAGGWPLVAAYLGGAVRVAEDAWRRAAG